MCIWFDFDLLLYFSRLLRTTQLVLIFWMGWVIAKDAHTRIINSSHRAHAIRENSGWYRTSADCAHVLCMFFLHSTLDSIHHSHALRRRPHNVYRTDTSGPHVVSSSAWFFVLDFEQFFTTDSHCVRAFFVHHRAFVCVCVPCLSFFYRLLNSQCDNFGESTLIHLSQIEFFAPDNETAAGCIEIWQNHFGLYLCWSIFGLKNFPFQTKFPVCANS